MEIVIREIEEKDYLHLLPIWNNELDSQVVTAENIARHYDRVKDDERYKTFIALSEDNVVGFVSSVQSYAVGFEGCFMQIIAFAVKKEAHRNGIGSKLLQKMEDYARTCGVYNIGLNTGVKRIDAHACYIHNGYTTGGNLNFWKML
jgi:GNAT superfamily N-acetyltransferase